MRMARVTFSLLVVLLNPVVMGATVIGFPGQLGAKVVPLTSPRMIGRPYGASLHFPGELENDQNPADTGFAKCHFGWTRTCNFLWLFMEPTAGDFTYIRSAGCKNFFFNAPYR